MRMQGTVCNAFKEGGTEKRRGETKISKKGGGGQAGSRGGCLKKGGAGTLLRTMGKKVRSEKK